MAVISTLRQFAARNLRVDHMSGAVLISLDCTVGDAARLWTKAASTAAHAFGMTRADIVETIGPREDPEISACAAIVMDDLVRRLSAGDPKGTIVVSITTAPSDLC